MEKKTTWVDDEISDLEDQLSELEQQKEETEQPYQDQLEEIRRQYSMSRQLLTSALWLKYNEEKEKWTREKYDLGFPKGCLVQAIKEKKNLNAFQQQLSTKQIMLDIQSGLQEAIDNGSIEASIQRFLKGEQKP
jgi:flagellar biosynthesis/type III secretory pathway protein FliH